MKNLFKILLLVLTIGFFTSCDEDIERVSDPLEETTVAAQQAAKDTMLVYHESKEKILLLDKETNVVQYELYGVNHNDGIFWFGFVVGVFVFAMIAGFAGAFDNGY